MVYNRGRYLPGRLLAIKVLNKNGEDTRFGIAVGKKVGGAVQRNRVKRRVREIAREVDVEQGWDIVVMARRSSAEATYSQISNEIRSLLNKVDLLVVKNEDNCISAD